MLSLFTRTDFTPYRGLTYRGAFLIAFKFQLSYNSLDTERLLNEVLQETAGPILPFLASKNKEKLHGS